MTRFVVLGRFQPFHKGHQYLVEKALSLAKDSDEVIVAVGSSQSQYEPTYHWTATITSSESFASESAFSTRY